MRNLLICFWGILLLTKTAGAVFIEGWQRPILQSDMEITQISEELSVQFEDVRMVQTSEDGTGKQGFSLYLDDNLIDFVVREKTDIGCASKVYVAETTELSTVELDGIVLEVHYVGNCETGNDRVSWLAKLQKSGNNGFSETVLVFEGSPMPVVTIL